ncbi:hypothetical protein BGZ54_004935 [Gamsiella multidivaricata]|nr:hypothetical protein BGZ54_004935 [Gamsiella multidivaricata]
MAKIAQQAPKAYGVKALQDYMEGIFAPIRSSEKKPLKQSEHNRIGQKFSSAEMGGRYALSNCLSNLIAFDVRRQWRRDKFKPKISDISKQFGTQLSIVEITEKGYEDAVAVGMVPGKITTSRFVR